MIKPIFSYKISERAKLLPNEQPAYLQLVIEGLTMISEDVYYQSHNKLIPVLAKKFNIAESLIEAISVEEYEAAPEFHVLEDELEVGNQR